MDLFKKNIAVGVSVTPEIGLEVAQIDFVSKTILKYGTRQLNYDNNRKEIADLDIFKETLQDLLFELQIPKGSEIYLNLPAITFKVKDYPASLNEEQISNAVEETEKQEQEIAENKEEISISINYNQFTNKYQNEVVITGVLETDKEENKLFENPTIYFELPTEVEKVIIDDVKLLYEDELTLGEYVVETNENGNQQIKVSLNGKQTKHQLGGIVKGANIRIVANIILKQDIETKTTNIIMKCGEATCNQEIQVINSTEIKTIEKVDETEGTKNFAEGILVETKAIRGDTVLNNDDIIYEMN